MPVCARGSLQRVLEAEENGDGCQDDEEFELDAPKRKNRNRNKVSSPIFDAFVRAELCAGPPASVLLWERLGRRERLGHRDVVF